MVRHICKGPRKEYEKADQTGILQRGDWKGLSGLDPEVDLSKEEAFVNDIKRSLGEKNVRSKKSEGFESTPQGLSNALARGEVGVLFTRDFTREGIEVKFTKGGSTHAFLVLGFNEQTGEYTVWNPTTQENNGLKTITADDFLSGDLIMTAPVDDMYKASES